MLLISVKGKLCHLRILDIPVFFVKVCDPADPAVYKYMQLHFKHRRRKWGRRGRTRGPNILASCRFGAAVFKTVLNSGYVLILLSIEYILASLIEMCQG